MNKKHFAAYLCTFLLLAILVVVKQHAITKKNERPAVSFYSSWKNDGKPVLVQKLKNNDQDNVWKMTVVFDSDNTYIGYVPKTIQRSLSTESPAAIDYHGKKVPATITHIDSILNKETGMYAVTVSCKETPGGKNEKYIVEASTLAAKNSVVLPFDAIETENNQSFVWVIKENRAHKQPVLLKERTSLGMMAEGIEAQDLVIIGGAAAIKENDTVKINFGN